MQKLGFVSKGGVGIVPFEFQLVIVLGLLLFTLIFLLFKKIKLAASSFLLAIAAFTIPVARDILLDVSPWWIAFPIILYFSLMLVKVVISFFFGEDISKATISHFLGATLEKVLTIPFAFYGVIRKSELTTIIAKASKSLLLLPMRLLKDRTKITFAKDKQIGKETEENQARQDGDNHESQIDSGKSSISQGESRPNASQRRESTEIGIEQNSKGSTEGYRFSGINMKINYGNNSGNSQERWNETKKYVNEKNASDKLDAENNQSEPITKKDESEEPIDIEKGKDV